MKPFDLDAALNGARVVTRNGKEVTQLTRFYDIESDECLCGVINAELQVWNEHGKYLSDENESPYDLFMAPNIKAIWVARYAKGIHWYHRYETRELCQASNPDAESYHKLEWEE